MKLRPATPNDLPLLLALLRESRDPDDEAVDDEWRHTQTAIDILLQDPQAGEAFLTLDETGTAMGYIIMCRGFSLEYGGYFNWVEETYLRQANQGRYRDERFSP